MRESGYLRLALMFGDNNASTFTKNLEKMIALVLHEKYGTSLTIVAIIDELKNSYGLDFSEAEIINVINGRHQNRIICINESKDYSLKSYSITPNEKERIDYKIENRKLSNVINVFLKENPDVHTAPDSFEEILKRYFYSVFNSNANTLSELLDQRLRPDLGENIKFSDEEKIQINSFLEWTNTDKDKYVYQMVSCCFDYCMMTVKRNKNAYQNIFRQKKFYLDTNIIFRMMGLNQENRKRLIDAFILKCKSVGIELLYTNHTFQEIFNTIDIGVRKINDLMHQNDPISVDAIRLMTSKYYNLSFYDAYVEWCKDKTNIVGDYKSFSNYLKQQANRILGEFTRKDFDDYRFKRNSEFNNYCETLKEYKETRRGYAKDEIVQTDVNNYMFIRFCNEHSGGNDFFGTHNYLISADHVLGDWAREQRPGSVPIVVLPSVWYSLILQYTGRTDDDFASFTRFLNFSLSSYDEEDSRKMEILKKVISLDEPKEIKERTIYDIQQKLSTNYKDFDSIDEIVNTSHEFIIDQERERITKAVRQEADKKIANYEQNKKAEFDQAIKELNNQQLDERTRHKKAELELTLQNKELLEKIEQAKQEGEKERAEKLADSKLMKTVILYWIIAGVIIVLFAFVGYVLVMKTREGDISWLPNIYKEAPIIIDIVAEIIIGLFGKVVYSKALCSLDKKKIRERLIERYLR